MILIIIEIVIVLIIVYSILGWSLFLMQSTFVYKPTQDIYYTPEELSLDFEDVVFKTKDGLLLNGWHVPADNSRFTVLFCHGNGGNIMHRLDSINFFNNMGLSCFIFDYRGYGKSQGRPTEDGTYLDAMAAYKWLVEEKNIPAENIIIFGRSLGASIAANLASKVKSRSLVIESTFTSYVDIGKKFYPYMPIRLFAKFKYRTIDYLKEVHCPVMIVHSRDDEIMPFEFALKLYQVANEPSEFIEIYGSHNDGFITSDEIYKKAWNKWLEFLKEQGAKSLGQQAS
ncbi:MAG: alpha/beta hydrolase [Planctomycetes bacterium]|nr:alpha/beta hydrolase [Planctomycetota bacterium]